MNIFNSDLLSKSLDNKSNSDIYTEQAYRLTLQHKGKDHTIVLDSETKKVLRKSYIQKIKLQVAKGLIQKLKFADIQKKQIAVDDFENFYKSFFIVNDYTVASFAKSNSSNENLTLYKTMFDLLNEYKKTKNPATIVKATTKK